MILCPVEGVAGSVQTFIELEAGAGYGLTEPVLVPGSHNRFKPRGYRCWRDPTGV